MRGNIPTAVIANPGLRGRLAAPPLGAFPQEAALFAVGEESPLEEKTSAAYGFSQHSIAEGVAVDCPARHSSQRLRWW